MGKILRGGVSALAFALMCGAALAQINGNGGGIAGNAASNIAAGKLSVFNVLSYGAKCNGSADDLLAIKAAIKAGAAKGIVYVPYAATACMISGVLNVPANSHLLIEGTIELLAGANSSIISVNGHVHNVTIEGHGTLDGNTANQTSGSGAGVGTAGDDFNITVRDLTIQNLRDWPVNIIQTTVCKLDNLTLTNSGHSAEFVQSTGCWADDLHISNINDECFAFYGGVTYSGIRGGDITGCAVDGVAVLNDSGQPLLSHDITISGVTAHGNQLAGVEVQNGTGNVAANSYNINIVGNTLSNNGLAGTGQGGVRINGAERVNIGNNVISGDGNNASGVYLIGTNKLITVSVNNISNEGQGGAGGVGITMSGFNCSPCTFSGNVIIDNQATPTMAFGFNGTVGTRNSFDGNIISGTIGTPYALTYPSDTVMFDPVGSTNIAQLAATTGGTFGINNTTTTLVMISAGIASYTLTLAANPPQGKMLTIACTGAVASLTITPGSGTLNNSPGACAANSSYTWQWANVVSQWIRLN